MKLIYFVFIILILYTSCSNKEIIKDQYTLQSTNHSISLTIPKDIKNISKCLEYYITSDNHQFLFYIGADSENEILIYNLDSLKIHSKIRMMKEGPIGVGNLKSLIVHNLDTIFLTTGQMNKLFIINWEGELMKNIPIQNYLCGDLKFPNDLIDHSLCFSKSIVYSEGNVFAGVSIPIFPDPEKLGLFKTTLEINLHNNVQKLLPMSYPNLIDKQGKAPYLYFSILHVKNKFIYSFLNSHDCLITQDHINIETKTVKSRYAKNGFKMPDFDSGNMLDIPRTILEHSSYENFMYDPYRDLIYRFCYPGISLSNKDNLWNMNEFKPIFSIMILDTDLNILGETMMPKNTYNMNMAFVGRDGLYLSTNHYLNKGFNADSLKFEIFNIIRNEIK